jgi:hypothetical protein
MTPKKKPPYDKEARIQQILRLLDIIMHEEGVDIELATKFDPVVHVSPSGIPLFTMGLYSIQPICTIAITQHVLPL